MSKSIITLLALALFNVFALLSSTTAISTAHAHGVRGLRPPSNQHVSASVRSLREEEGIETEKETETEIETETVPPVPLNIVGGQDASLNEFPYFVSFPDAKCGGTLVAEDRVLTSGGCIENHGVPATVFVGGLNATDGVEVAVACAKRHPDYRKTGETIFNDVAMLKLVEPVTGVTPVQFNPNRDYPPAVLDGTEGPVTTIGLGFINNAGTRANTLQKATMTLVGSEACKAYFEPGVIFENTHACAEATDIGFCGGDGGGPLIDSDSGVQIGVASFTYGLCASNSFADVYADVGTFANWINNQISSNACDETTPVPAPSPTTQAPTTAPPTTQSPTSPSSPTTTPPASSATTTAAPTAVAEEEEDDDDDGGLFNFNNLGTAAGLVIINAIKGGVYLADRIFVGITTGDWSTPPQYEDDIVETTAPEEEEEVVEEEEIVVEEDEDEDKEEDKEEEEEEEEKEKEEEEDDDEEEVEEPAKSKDETTAPEEEEEEEEDEEEEVEEPAKSKDDKD